jgi:polysaccharide export outer membrane protein
MINTFKKVIFVSLLILGLFFLESCKNRSIILKVPRNYKFENFEEIHPIKEYKIAVNDKIEISFSSNKGIGEFEVGATTSNGIISKQTFSGTIDFDGTLKMPVLGRVYMKDLTIREAELLMEEKYKVYFVDPYVNVRVSNKRVIFFPGSGASASVLYLQNENTTLLEALALTGGVHGKAKRIKLIRGDLKNPKIYLIDLSTIDKMKNSDLILQGNDILYVEPFDDYLVNFVGRFSGIFVFINFLFFVYSFIPKN